MLKLEINHFIQAAHQLPDSDYLITKACQRLHGHSYKIKVEIKNTLNNRGGMVVDFKAVKDIIDMLDHRFINDVFKENNFNEPTTAENIALFLRKEIMNKLYFTDVAVGVCEGYKGEESSNWVWA